MKSIIEFFVKQTLFGNLLTIAVIVLGIASIILIRRETFPNVNFDIVSVQTIFPGATPDDTEKLITNLIEQDLQEVDGIKKLQSSSLENLSNIVIFLDPDQTTAEKGKSDVQDVIDKITDLPNDSKSPIVTSLESKTAPIIEVAIAADLPALEMRKLAKFLEREVERVPGVARVVHRGLRDLEVRVEPDVKKLASYRVSVDELVASLSRQNLSIPAGVLEARVDEEGARERFVRTVGEFKTIKDVEETVVRSNDLGASIRVKDLARVTNDLAKATVLTRVNGQSAMVLTVLKKETADVIDLVKDVKARLAEIKPKLGEEVRVSFVNDFSYYVKNRLSVLSGNLVVGLALVLLILPLFLPFRFAMIISLGLPFAFLGTITLFYNMGVTINLLTMIGLIIVLGMLVDDAIVATENSARLIEGGMDPKEAAVKGTYQVVKPITASVLTTMVAFAPLMFMSGIFGKFVMYIPLGLIIALVVSLVEAFLILPGHVAEWITPAYLKRLQEDKPKGPLEKTTRRFQKFWDQKVTPAYIRTLRKFVHHRYLVMLGLIVLVVSSLLLATKGMRVVLFPPEGIDTFFIRTETPIGTSLDRHASLIKPIEDVVKTLPKEELDNFTTTIGIVQQDPNDPATRRGSEYAQIAIYLTPESKRDRLAAEIIEELREKVGTPEGFTKVTFNRVNPGPPTGKAVSLSVRGREYEEILPAVRELQKILSGLDGVTDISDTYVLGKEELQIKVDPSEAAAAGLTVASVGNTVRAVYEGILATSIRELEEEIDVRVIFPRDQRSTSEALDQVLIPNQQGSLIPLNRIAKTETTRGLSFHEHEGGSRQVRVTADVDVKKTSSLEVNGKIRELLPEFGRKYPDLRIVFGGEDEDTAESFQSLGRAFGVALMGILLILVMTFRSLLQPLLVLMTVPIGLVAVILAFFVHGMPLSFLAMMGMVALSGVIVNNAIVMVDFVNERRAEGADRFESIFTAARDRIRPIFLTTATTVFGVLPTAYGIGGTDKFVVPIAMALGWGIMFGSIMTAFIFPAALAVLDDILAFKDRKFGTHS